MLRNWLLTIWERWSTYIIGIVLIASSLLISARVRAYYSSHFLDDLIVALLIAGILALTVDPILKARMHREVAKDLFQHMLGFGLPEVIRERLQDTVEQTKLYRRDMKEYIVVREEGSSIVFDTEVEFRVINPTANDRDFVPQMEFENGEHAALKSVVCFEDQNCGKGCILKPTKDGRQQYYKGSPVKIPAGGEKRFKYEYSLKYPTEMGFYFPHFKYPTIGLSLTIKAPQNIKIYATPTAQESPGEWRYPTRLFMPGEQFGITWEKLN